MNPPNNIPFWGPQYISYAIHFWHWIIPFTSWAFRNTFDLIGMRPLTASKTHQHIFGLVFSMFIWIKCINFSIVFKFNFSNGLCMAWGPQKGQVVFQSRQNYNTKTEQKEPVWINLMFIKQIIWYVYFVGTVMCNGCLLVRQLPFLSDSAK